MAFNRNQKLRDNIEAIRTAFLLDREQRTATEKERMILQKYCGFGGLKCILNPAKELTDAIYWAKSDLKLFAPTVELFRLIRENSKDDAEYKRYTDSLKGSVLTAFYTPKEITDTLADILHEHGIRLDRVLEPSAGVGAFVDAVLQSKPDADIMAFEKDLMTGKILGHLYPNQKIRVQGFEKIEKPFTDYFDLAISNIPFGDVAVFDPEFTGSRDPARRTASKSIHNYFFLKSLDAVREGGIVAFITSRGVLDTTSNEPIREYMMRNANLVAATRLPNNLFTDNAGTEVGSDLIILQKNSSKRRELNGYEKMFIQTQKTLIGSFSNRYVGSMSMIFHSELISSTDFYGKPVYKIMHRGSIAQLADDLREHVCARLPSQLDRELYDRYSLYPPRVESTVADVRPAPAAIMTEDIKKAEPVEEKPEIESRQPHQPEGVQLSLFSLWGMTEETRKQETSVKKTVKSGNTARRMPLKPQVQITSQVTSVTPEVPIVSASVNKETTAEHIIEQNNPEEVYSAIDWETNPPVNGFYEMMLNLTPERRMELRQKAVLHRQEHLQKRDDRDISDAVIVPSSAEQRPQITATDRTDERESGSISKTVTEPAGDTFGKVVTSLFPEMEKQEGKAPDLVPRPYYRTPEMHLREGSLVANRAHDIGYLKDITSYGATFQPLGLTGYQKEKALQYVSLRDAYERLYRSELYGRVANPVWREHLNTCYDEFVQRYGPLNAKQNVNLVLMDVGGRDILSLERAEEGKFVKADIFSRPVSFSVETDTLVDSPDEALSASLNKYGTVNLEYMRRITGSTEKELLAALHGRIYYNPLAESYEIKDRFIAGNVIEKAESIEAWMNGNSGNERISEVKQALDALKEAEPPKITFEELDFNFGERWIPTGIYSAYMTHLYGTDVRIGYNESLDEFSISCRNRENLKIKNEFAVQGYYKSYDGIALLKHALVNTCPDMMKSIGKDENGNDIKVRDSEKIQLANAKIDEIRNGFSEWLEEQSPEFKERLVTLYNRKFNCFVRPKYDGSHQTFPDLNLKGLASRGIKSIYPSQKDCVWMLKQNGGGICDHEVVRP